MPRPRIVRLRKGEVIIKNLSKRETDDIERFLTTPIEDRREVVFNEEKEEYELVENKDPFKDSTLSQAAFGFFSNDLGHHAVELTYDPKTGMGKVVDVKFLHKNINVARSQFQVLVNKKF